MDADAIDNQLFEARRMMVDLFDGEDEITAEQAFTLLRLAYGKGYIDASRETDQATRARVAEGLGLLNMQTGEIFG